MNIEFKQVSATPIILHVINKSSAPVITDTPSALDLIASARYQYPDAKLIIDQKDIEPVFFDLKTRIAGEILQKFVNYHMAMAILGDFSMYSSKSLHDFIYESNQGNTLFFVAEIETAIDRLSACS